MEPHYSVVAVVVTDVITVVSIMKISNNASLHVFYHSNKGKLSGKNKIVPHPLK